LGYVARFRQPAVEGKPELVQTLGVIAEEGGGEDKQFVPGHALVSSQAPPDKEEIVYLRELRAHRDQLVPEDGLNLWGEAARIAGGSTPEGGQKPVDNGNGKRVLNHQGSKVEAPVYLPVAGAAGQKTDAAEGYFSLHTVGSGTGRSRQAKAAGEQ
jgi:hypothetical protein